MPDGEQPFDASKAAREKPGLLARIIDRFHYGNPSLTVLVDANSPKGSISVNLPTRVFPSLQPLAKSKDIQPTPYGRYRVAPDVDIDQLNLFKNTAYYASDYGQLSANDYRSLSSQNLSLLQLIQIFRVGIKLDDVPMRRKIMEAIELYLPPPPYCDLRLEETPVIRRQAALAFDLAVVVDLALLVDEIDADWLRPAILDWLYRISALNVDVTQPVAQAGCLKMITLPPSFVTSLASCGATGSLSEMAHTRSVLHRRGPFSRRCLGLSACSPWRTSFLSQLDADPLFLGLEPINKDTIGDASMCEECWAAVQRTDATWTLDYFLSLPCAFALQTSWDDLRLRRNLFFSSS
ncbi:hypothetical protein HDZ31DRAFT_67200 [Schizophyllum fasciatum]